MLATSLLVCLLAFVLPPFPERYSDLRADISLRLADREGRPLRGVLSSRQGIDVWVSLEEMAPELVSAVLTSEDSRFYSHPGVDPFAIVRAVRDNLEAGRIVSGASTITNQLLRTFDPPGERALPAKIAEAYWAIRLEGRTDKDELLEAYLNRAAFGPGVYGAEEASRYYFSKSAGSLSLAESALLAVLLRSPTGFDPFSEEGRTELKGWTDELISRMEDNAQVTPEVARRARAEEWQMSQAPPPFLAAHFCDLALPLMQGLRGEQRTSLDLNLQQAVEGMVANHLKLLSGHRVTNAAVVVAQVETGEVVALAGSGAFARAKDGQHNAAVSLRQPGSTLKPFTYALLLESVGHAGHVLPDLPVYSSAKVASYIPDNYDGRFHGPVSVRTALGSSYNVPAVKALEQVGVEALLLRLRRLGLDDLTEAPDHYGLGLTLGDGSASLWQLVEAYRTLARQGQHSSLSLRQGAPKAGAEKEVFDPRVAALITDVLSDRKARIPSFGSPNVLEFPFPVAVKTGTSKGYRDNWCVGYTPKYVVGVWVGNSDGSPMRQVSGITGAGPLFRDVMLKLGDGGDFPPSQLPERKICSLSGKAANEVCPQTVVEPYLPEVAEEDCAVCLAVRTDGVEQLRYRVDPIYREWAGENGLPLWERETVEGSGFRLVFPQDGDVFLLDSDLRQANQRLKLRAVAGQPPLLWWVDGKPLAGTGPEAWWSLRPGKHQVKVREAGGAEDALTVSVLGQDKKPDPTP